MAGPGGAEVGRISIRVVPDVSGFRRELKTELEAVEKSSRFNVDVGLDLISEGFREKVKAFTESTRANVDVATKLDESDFARTLGEARAAAKAADIKLDVAFRDKKAEADLAAVLAKLKAEAKLADIEVDLKINRHFIRRSIFDNIGKFGRSVKNNFGSFLRIVGDQGKLIALAIIGFFAPLVGLISGFIAGLPALIAGIALPIGTLLLGLQGLKAAASGLAQPFTELKEAVSGQFKDAFTPIFDSLKPLLEMGKTALKPIVDGLAAMTEAFTSVLTSQSGMKLLQQAIDGIANAMKVAAPGIANFTKGMLGLMGPGAQNLQLLSDIFNDLGDSFSAWVSDLTKRGPDGVSQLDMILSNLKGPVEEFLKQFGRLIGVGANLMADPKFAANITRFLQMFGDFAVAFLKLSEHIFNGITYFFDGLGIIGSWIGKFGSLIAQIPDLVGSGLAGIGSFFSRIGQKFQKYGVLISGAMGSIKQAITTGWNTVKTTTINIWNGIYQSVAQKINLIKSAFSNIGAAMSGAWAGVKSAAQSAWNGIVAAARLTFTQVVQSVVTAAGRIVGELASWPGKFRAAVGNMGSVLVGAGKALVQGFINGIQSAIGGAIAKAKELASNVAGAVKNALGIHSPSRVMHEVGVNVGVGFQNGVEASFKEVIQRARQLANQVAVAVKNGASPAKFRGQLQRQVSEIGLLRQQMLAANTGGTKGITAERLKQLGLVNRQLKAQQKQLGFTRAYGKQLGKNNKMLGGALVKMVGIGRQFGEANIKQFASDVGISGRGAVSQIAEMGAGWGTSLLGKMIQAGAGGGTTIQVNSVDQALQAKQTLDNRKALQYNRR